MPRTALLALALVLTAAAPHAQGVLPLSGAYRGGSIGTSFGEPPCSPGALPACHAAVGTATFQTNGTFTLASSSLDICAGGTSQSSNANDNGTYTVDTQGQLVLDSDPGNPGEDISTFFLRADGTVAVEGRTETSPESFLSVLVKLSSGLGNSSLNGAYHVARLVQSNSASGYSMRAELGAIVFDGTGGWTESGVRHSILLGSTATNVGYNANGSYAVASDGTITANDIEGAMSANGEIFFWVRRAAGQSEVELTVGVRKGASYSPSSFGGDWGIATIENFVASSVDLETSFVFATATPLTPLTPQVPSQGTLAATVFNVSTSAFASSADLSVETDSYTLSSKGELVLLPSEPVPGGLGAAGTFCVGILVSDEGAGMFAGVLRCLWPRPFGIATPGSGGFAPLASTRGGFPHLGNANYQLGITAGRGGAAGVLLLSSGTSAGIPFLGGTIWVNPSLLISVPIALTGPPGAAGTGSGFAMIPVPNLTVLDGASFAFQGFVADPSAPRGLAMTQALIVQLCR